MVLGMSDMKRIEFTSFSWYDGFDSGMVPDAGICPVGYITFANGALPGMDGAYPNII